MLQRFFSGVIAAGGVGDVTVLRASVVEARRLLA